MICHGCGGLVGRDCFNPQECEQITRSLAEQAQSESQENYSLRQQLEAEKKKSEELTALVTEGLSKTSELQRANEELMEALNNLINDTSYLNAAGTTRYMWGRYSGDTLSPASAAAIEVLTKHTPKVKEDGE